MSAKVTTPEQIVKYLNTNEHEHNLEDYLVIYGGIQTRVIKHSHVEKVSLKSITISYGSEDDRKLYEIKFLRTQPSYENVKAVLYGMAKEAASKRGYSAYILDTIPLPNKPINLLYWTIFMISVFIAFANTTTLSILTHDFGMPLKTAERVASVTRWIVNTVFVTHSTEMATTLNPILYKYRTPMIQRVIASVLCLIEGTFFINRIEAYTKSLEEK